MLLSALPHSRSGVGAALARAQRPLSSDAQHAMQDRSMQCMRGRSRSA
jgi:hypothetical protein